MALTLSDSQDSYARSQNDSMFHQNEFESLLQYFLSYRNVLFNSKIVSQLKKTEVDCIRCQLLKQTDSNGNSKSNVVISNSRIFLQNITTDLINVNCKHR